MSRPQGAYVVRTATANPDATRGAGLVVLIRGLGDVPWRRQAASTLRAAGATVRVASGAAEAQKALRDGQVTHALVDEPPMLPTVAPSEEMAALEARHRVIRRLPDEPGDRSAARLLECVAAQGTTST